jgi:hypothetical protein
MEPFESGVIDHIFKLLTKIVNFKVKFRVKLCRLLKECGVLSEKIYPVD